MNTHRTFRLLLLMALVAAMSNGCVCLDLESEPEAAADKSATAKPDKSAAAADSNGAQADDKAGGRFILQYQKPKNPDFADLAEAIKSDDIYNKYVDDLNANIRIPHDIPISFEGCGEQNAFYDPEKRRVIMCYEMVSYVIELSQEIGDAEEFEHAITGTTLEIMLHETGHALVDVLDLPLTGKEEDAVDQMAMFILLSYEEEGESFALASANFQLRMDADEDVHPENLPFWGQHSFTMQRYYNSMCLVYGRDPDKHAEMVGQDYLPEERAHSCPEEYEKLVSSWSRILSPHYKKQK